MRTVAILDRLRQPRAVATWATVAAVVWSGVSHSWAQPPDARTIQIVPRPLTAASKGVPTTVIIPSPATVQRQTPPIQTQKANASPTEEWSLPVQTNVVSGVGQVSGSAGRLRDPSSEERTASAFTVRSQPVYQQTFYQVPAPEPEPASDPARTPPPTQIEPPQTFPPPYVPAMPVPGTPGPVPQTSPLRIPLHGPPGGQLNVKVTGDRITLTAQDAPLDAVLSLIAQQHGLSIVGGGTAGRLVTVTLVDVALQDALDAILSVNGYTWTREGNILMISPLSPTVPVPAHVQGRRVQVFPLSYVAAIEADKVVKGLLSPVGKSFVVTSDPADKRRTGEQLVVEDIPEYVVRIADYIAQVDCPPRQVLIEAQVLRVDLRDETNHGVDFSQLIKLTDAEISLKTTGMANPGASPAFLLGVDGPDMAALLEALKLTTDAKTLASPKVLAVNGQKARIQIGEQLGYFVTTTTQTSTLQSVQFLDVGVVLNVTPIISEDGQVLMSVKPEVSNGRINPATGLPEEETTEVETTVLLADGQGMIIGGLIQERDTDNQSKIPVLGDLWGVGRLFQKTNVIRQRSEIVIALIPRIVPYTPAAEWLQRRDLDRVHTPLMTNDLRRLDRTHWEPGIADAVRNPRRLSLRRLPKLLTDSCDDRPHEPTYYFPTPGEAAPAPQLFSGSQIVPSTDGYWNATIEPVRPETQAPTETRSPVPSATAPPPTLIPTPSDATP